jgi:hypothetical protein
MNIESKRLPREPEVFAEHSRENPAQEHYIR